MFTVEIRINGSMIGHIYGINEETISNGFCKYAYEYYEPELRKTVKGHVNHLRDEGVRELISHILNDINSQEQARRKLGKVAQK